MYFSSRSAIGAAVSAALLAPLASAQTPDGFTPSVSQKLSVTYGTKAVDPAGITLEKADTQTIPALATGGESLKGTFLFMMIDLDVPVRSGGAITGRQTLLHALVGNFTAGADGTLTSTTADQAPAPYFGPSPPAENPAKPHRYTQLLFQQPENFAIPASQASAVEKRIGFDAAAFISAAGLSAPLQGNFYQVVNTSLAEVAAGKSESEGGATKTEESPTKTKESGQSAETGKKSGAATGTGAMPGRASATGAVAPSEGLPGTGTGSRMTATASLDPSMFTGAADVNNVRHRFGAAVAAGAALLIL